MNDQQRRTLSPALTALLLKPDSKCEYRAVLE